jgi:hypothetical protein
MNNLQDQMDSLNARIQEELNTGMQESNAIMLELRQAKEDLQAQMNNQAQEQRVTEHVAVNGYILDTLTTSNGTTMAELSYSPENHELVCIAVQKAFLAQQDAFNGERDMLNSAIGHLEDVESALEGKVYVLSIEKDDAAQKRDNAVRLAEELQAKLDQQVKGAVEIAPLSAEEQEAKLINELNGKRIKVINLKPKSDAFNEKMFTATNALTGLPFEDYLLYSKRYEEITEEQAVQLQTDYAQKKADLNPTIVEVPAQIAEEPAAVDTPQEEVPTTVVGLDGNKATAEVVGTEAEGTVQPEPQTIEQVVGHIAELNHLLFVLGHNHSDLVARVEALEKGKN